METPWSTVRNAINGPSEHAIHRALDLARISPRPPQAEVVFKVELDGGKETLNYTVTITGMLVMAANKNGGDGKIVSLFGRVIKKDGAPVKEKQWFTAILYNTQTRKDSMFRASTDLKSIRDSFIVAAA